MKTLNYNFKQLKIEYDISLLAPLENILFIDIETTGLSSKTASLYIIGACSYKGNAWNGIQWFAEKPEEEINILNAFFTFASDYSVLIHFNGNQFDLPFILGRCEVLNLSYNFDNFDGIDIYKRVALCKHFLQLPNCKQKSIEKFLHLDREDKYSGGEMVKFYESDDLQDAKEFAIRMCFFNECKVMVFDEKVQEIIRDFDDPKHK